MTHLLCLWLAAALAPLGGTWLPPVGPTDLNVFPPRPVAMQVWVRCKEERDAANCRAQYLPEPQGLAEWRRAEVWADACEVWDCLTDAQNCKWSRRHRLERLERLRTLLGGADYYAGRMPWP